MRKAVFAMLMVLSSQRAWANETDPFNAEQLKENAVKPDPGIATAKVAGDPAWCDVVGKMDPESMVEVMGFNRGMSDGVQRILRAAHDVCANRSDPTWRQMAGYILQQWMNWTGQSQADAEKSMRARLKTDTWNAQHDALCKALDVSPEAAAEVKTFSRARLSLFGCTNQNQALWQSRDGIVQMLYYLDSDLQTDPLMRVYWLETYVPNFDDKLPAKDAYSNRALLDYAAAAPDFAKVDRAELDKLMQAPPYNEYARIILNETVGDLIAKRGQYEQAIDKLAKGDEDYTAILRKAPQQAYADWDKLVAAWKPEMERSEAFEKLEAAPSHKAMKGCSTQLLKDAEKVTKQFKDLTYNEMTSRLKSDPMANLLFSRLWVCTAYDSVRGISGVLHRLVNEGRGVRGPRSLAQYAIVDAYAAAAVDRPRMVLSLQNFHPGDLNDAPDFDEHEFHDDGTIAIDGDRDWTVKGIVASTKKTGEGIIINFKKTGYKFQNYACSDTNKPERIDDSGRIIYQQVCHNVPGSTSVDTTPSPVMIPLQLEAGLKPGVFVMVWQAAMEKAKSGQPLAVPMYTTKSPADRKVTSYYGFPTM